MKKKLFQNYYSKLMSISFLIVFILVLVASAFALFYLDARRTESTTREHDKVLSELIKTYDDILGNYQKTFEPIYDTANKEVFQLFCEGNFSGYAESSATRKFREIMADICKQDARIKGVYFRRYADDARYLYLTDGQKLNRVSFQLESDTGDGTLRRVMVGAREIAHVDTVIKRPNVRVFGIQSAVLSLKNERGAEFQITILYDVSCFEDIVNKYDLDSEARFYMTTEQGLVLYDSWGEYRLGQDTYYENLGRITAGKGTFTEDDTTFAKKVDNSEKGNTLAYYIVPADELRSFIFNGMTAVVFVAAFVINVLVLSVLISMNRLFGRKFAELEKGLNQIGVNNLKYRIPVGTHEDEFSRIAVRFNKMCDDLKSMIDRNYVYQVLQQKAEYQALKTSVNPHFLYNSLEVIRGMLDESGQEDAAEVVLLLSRIFDYQIHGDSIVEIWMEQEALQNYIDFSAVRYRYAFDYTFDFDDRILDYKIPKQIFQPIAENYFQHGFRGDGTDYIAILGYVDDSDDMIHISFCDNGKGASAEQIKKINRALEEEEDQEHLGLASVHQRLKLLFGKNCRVDFVSNAPDPGVTVSLVFGKVLKMDDVENQVLSGENRY